MGIEGFEDIKKKCGILETRLAMYQEDSKNYAISLDEVEEELLDAEQAAYILQEVGRQTQENLEFHISNLVTSALHAVNPEWPEFIARFVVRNRAGGGQTECNLLFKEGEHERKPDGAGNSGGSMDVAAFALRIGIWSLNKNRATFLLDEPFKFVSPGFQNKVSKMVKMLCDSLNIQIVMVSHADDIEDYSDKSFTVKKTGKISEVT